MKKRIHLVGAGLIRNETGSALILVLVLLVLGSLVILPALANVGTVLKTGARYEEKTNALYAADAGIEDAICQIKNDQLPYVLAGQGYHRYAFGDNWSYDLDSPVNDLTTTVTIHNVWIPRKDADTEIAPPSDPAEIAAAVSLNKLMVSGTADNSSGYEISISFTPETGDNLTIESIGIWLPYGFGYVPGSSNLEDDMFAPCYDVPTVFEHAGGQGVVWDFAPPPPITAFPNFSGGGVQTTRISFSFTSNTTGAKPAAIAWMETEDYLVIDDILPVTWDIDTSVFGISSMAGGTEIEAYLARYELRDLDNAISGDYKATGNSLMLCDHSSSGIRDTLLNESDGTFTAAIPSNAVVTQAYLYWAAWFDENRVLDENCEDFTDNAWTRSSPSGWAAYSSYTYGWRYGGHSTEDEGDPQRYLTSKTLNLSGLDPNSVVEVRWDQRDGGTLESDDELQYQFYGNGQWSELYTAFADDIDETSLRFTNDIPADYWAADFKLRFYLKGFADGSYSYTEYAYLDNIAVTWYVPAADTSAKFEINGVQVYLDEDGNPHQGLEELTATTAEQGFVDNRRGYSYRIKKDVTKLLQAYTPNGSPEHLAGNGNATYTVGNVSGDLGDQLAWGGWSIIVIYASPETAGHRLYLFDRFAFNQGYQNLDFDFDGLPGGDIDGFIVPEPIEGDADPYAGHMTCFVGEGDDFITGDKLKFTGQSGYYMYFTNGTYHWYNVWNMHSPGMSFDGVDVDTFEIPWENGSGQDLVRPGDTTAHLDLPSETTGGYDGSDAWNLVYLILSLRSLTTTSGTTHYVIHNY